MKTQYVKDLQKNQLIEGETFLIIKSDRAEDKNGKPYYKIVLGDKTGQIESKIWSDKLSSINEKDLKNGKIVKVSGKVDEFKGNSQLNIFSLEAINDEQNLEEFLESSEFNADKMMDELIEIIDTFENKKIKNVIKNIVTDKEINRKLKYWPASTAIHHNFRSGLLQHILEMINVANGLDKFYPEANMDILRAGIILHDLGKLFELDGTDLAIPYTKEGTLLGHIYLGARLFEKFADELPEDIRLHLIHLILSHHGKQEFGSPVVPATVEALMLFYIDNISAKPRTAYDLRKKLDPNKFSSRVLWLENAFIWNFKMPDEEIEPDLGFINSDDDQIPLV